MHAIIPAIVIGLAPPAERNPRVKDFELITSWLLGKDTMGVFPRGGFADKRWLIEAKDAVIYTDVYGAKIPKGFRAVPYDFLGTRLSAVRSGSKGVSPAVIIAKSVAKNSNEGPSIRRLRKLQNARIPKKPLKNVRYYYVEVAIGNLAHHWMKIAIGTRDGKRVVKFLWAQVS